MRTKLKTAKLGVIECTAPTMKAAKASLATSLEWLASNEGNLKTECRFGLVGILAPIASGWLYRIIDQDHINQSKDVSYCCMMGRVDYRDALSEMRNAMCQRAWNQSVDDDAHIAASNCLESTKRELASLFRHYRANYPHQHSVPA